MRDNEIMDSIKGISKENVDDVIPELLLSTKKALIITRQTLKFRSALKILYSVL